MQAADERTSGQDRDGDSEPLLVSEWGSEREPNQFASQWPVTGEPQGDFPSDRISHRPETFQQRFLFQGGSQHPSPRTSALNLIEKAGLESGGADGPGAGPAWQLVRELVATMQISERSAADHWHVRMTLKDGEFQGTDVRMDRVGHRLSVVFEAASMDAFRLLNRRVEELQETLERCSGCFVEMAVRLAEGLTGLGSKNTAAAREIHEG